VPWGDLITLIAVLPFADPAQAVDSEGYSVPPQEEKTTVFANKKSVGFNEFFKAKLAGYTEEMKFDVYTVEYTGQSLAEYEGKRYKVLRTYVDPKQGGDITELTLSDMTQDGRRADGGI
jgi:SPP1 family predicted phage head-tail adaptor